MFSRGEKITYPKWYDVTVSKDAVRKTVCKKNADENDVFNVVKEKIESLNPDRYVIGDEVGEGGYQHYQIRMVLKKETDPDIVIAKFVGLGRVSPTKVRDFRYCEKEGKFYRSWETALNRYVNITPTMWQAIALDMLRKQDERHILCVVDEKGAHGKSYLRKHLCATHEATYIPPMEKAEDIMAVAMAKPSKGYIIDLPRADGKVARSMWSAIEQLKDGYLYDKRYNWKELWIDPPKVIVFCNDFDTKNISADRIEPFDISDWPVIA